jgi:lysophospholipase L1-like esterase
MKPTVFPSPPFHRDSPARLRASTTGLARRLLLLGVATLAATIGAPAAVTDISGTLTQVLDSVVGAGNSGRLTANTQSYWAGTNSVSDVDLNSFQFSLDNGGGNAQTYNGTLTGPGTIRINGRFDASWDPDIRLAGTVANTPTSVVLNAGRVTLNKTDGVDALAGTITAASGTSTKRIWLQKSNQIHDDATIDSSSSGGLFELVLNGFNERIAGLTLGAGHKVSTGIGGVLNVDSLTVDGVPMPKGAYSAGSHSFVTGTGYIDVDDFGPPVIENPPDVPASPVPADEAANIHPAFVKKLEWGVSSGATSYDIYLWQASESKPGAPNATVVTNEYTLPADLLSLTEYDWQVVAKNTIGNTDGPVWSFTTVARWELAGSLPAALDTIIGAGNSGLLVGNTTSYWAGTNSVSNVDLGGFEFHINTGGGNHQIYNGAMTGPGALRITGRYTADWNLDAWLGGTSANSPTSVILSEGRVTLNKTAGVDALAGVITIAAGGSTKRIWLQNNHQINDASTIDSTASSGFFELMLNGFNETIAGLTLNAGHVVNTGTGGVLTVTSLTVNGELKGPGTYTSSSGFVTGSGSVVVPGATPPADADLSTVSASPSSVTANGVASSTITVTLLDNNGNPAIGKSVTLASDRGATDTISAASGPSDVSGAVTFTVSSLTTGSPVFTATDTTDTVTIVQTATVTFTANPPASPGQSTVSASPASVPANGSSTATVTVTLKDSGGSPLAGKTVTLASDRGATDLISAASGVSNASGVVTFTVASLAEGTPVFTATVTNDSVVLTETAAVTFTTASNVVDISNALHPWEPSNPNAGVKIDVVVASDETARLVGVTQTHWTSGGFSRPVDLNGNTLIIDSGGGNPCAAGGPITGNGLVRVNAGGIGMIPIRGSTGNTYTGSTEINSGPVKLEKTSGNALNGTITVNGAMSNNFPNTGNLLWGGDHQVNDASNLILSEAASLNPAGYTDTVGTLAITGNANIYLGASTSVLRFADSSATTWTADKQLIIREWNGSPAGGGTEGVFFGTSAGGLSAGQLVKVGFMNPAGFATGLYQAAILATGEVVPSGTAVVPVNPPYDLSPAATAARSVIYTSTGRADLTAAGSPLANDTRIVFFGDSITWQNSYISLLNSAMASGAGTQGKNITLINRGINGGGVLQVRDGAPDSGYPGSTPQASFASLLASDQADIAVVFIGINDVWWRGTSAATFEQALRDLAATAATQGVTLIFATPAARNESPVGAGPNDAAIDQYSAIMETVASDTGSTFVDLRSAFVAWWQNHNYEIRLDGSYFVLKEYGFLTYDGVHPTSLGNQMIADHIADGILAALSTTPGFDSWAATKGLVGADAAFDADPDGDGIHNGIEFVLGGEPNPAHPDWNSNALLPTGEVVGDDFVITFTLMNEAAYLEPVVEFNTGLDDPWTTAIDPANATIDIAPGEPAATVIVTIPKNGRSSLFARLTTSVP